MISSRLTLELFSAIGVHGRTIPLRLAFNLSKYAYILHYSFWALFPFTQRAQKEHKDFSDLFKNLRYSAMQHNTILCSSLIRSGGQVIHSCHSLMLRDQGCCIGLFTYIHKLGEDFSFSTVDFILGSLSIQNWSGWILQQGTKHLQASSNGIV
jgi:hypothetical protein